MIRIIGNHLDQNSIVNILKPLQYLNQKDLLSPGAP